MPWGVRSWQQETGTNKEEVMLKDELIKNRNIRLAIALKTNQLRREQLSSLTYQHVESALIGNWQFAKNV